MAGKWMISEEELDDDQYSIRQLQDGNYLIEGCAGSGKTVLALHKAKEIKDLEKGTYLIIVYTKALESFIQDGIDSLGLDASCVYHYDEWKNISITEVDYVIVDEVQDFPKERIQHLINIAKKEFIFFGDDAQQIYSNKTNNMTLDEIKTIGNIHDKNHKHLYNNYRLPKSIAEYASFIATAPGSLVNRCKKQSGQKPLIIDYEDSKEELNAIRNIIQNEGWEDVGILVAINKQVKELKDYFTERGFEVEYKYDDDIMGERKTYSTLDFNTTLPKILTYHSSKGLQFDHVFLPNCGVDYKNNDFKDALYVAITRAAETLFISYFTKLSPFLSHIPSSYFDFQSKKN